MHKDFQQVPCNGCMRCCRRDVIRLFPFEDASQYKTVPHPSYIDTLMLDHKKNLDCIYLGKKGCTIQATKPYMCRTMDCRVIAKKLNFIQAQRAYALPVWRKGKELLKNE